MKHNNLYAVILVGGSGTRFWPLSRKDNPKQFLNIFGKENLFEKTLQRASRIARKENIFIVSNRRYKKKIAGYAKKFSILSSNILLEPQAKNTAPAVCWAASRIYKMNPEALMLVLPSDHLIAKQKAFEKVLSKTLYPARDNHLVTLGIVPTLPDTGYGYLKTSLLKKYPGILKVQQFVEKPPLAKAKQFVKAKNYFWNSGMFVFKAGVILEEFKKFLPKIYRALIKEKGTVKPAQWAKLPSISIDYGIMEKSQGVVAVPAKGIGWSDVGSWDALYEILTKDKNGNVLKGNVLNVSGKNLFVHTKNRLIAAVGLKDLIIVDSPPYLLICPRGSSQAVKQVANLLG